MLSAVVCTAGPTRRMLTLPIHPDADTAATGGPSPMYTALATQATPGADSSYS